MKSHYTLYPNHLYFNANTPAIKNIPITINIGVPVLVLEESILLKSTIKNS